jgi:hypothetical protein
VSDLCCAPRARVKSLCPIELERHAVKTMMGGEAERLRGCGGGGPSCSSLHSRGYNTSSRPLGAPPARRLLSTPPCCFFCVGSHAFFQGTLPFALVSYPHPPWHGHCAWVGGQLHKRTVGVSATTLTCECESLWPASPPQPHPRARVPRR